MSGWYVIDGNSLVTAGLLGTVTFYVVMRIGAWLLFPKRDRPIWESRMWRE